MNLGTAPGQLLVSDEPSLGIPLFGLSEPPEIDPLLQLNIRLFFIEARLQALEDATLSARLRRVWRTTRRQAQRLWAATIRLSQRVRG
jgi:hypothetical protein